LDFTGMSGLLPLGVAENSSTVHCFSGKFMGNNHWIRGLRINTIGKAQVAGLFGHIDGDIYDLRFDEDCEFIGIKSGSVAGELVNSGYVNITNIQNYGRIEGENIGGVIGYVESRKRLTIIFEECHNYGEVSAITKEEKNSLTLSAGGITGTLSFYYSNNYVQHISCSNDGPVTIHVGGFTNTVKSLTCRCGGILGGHDYFGYGDSLIFLCNNNGPVSIVVDDYSTVTELSEYVAIAGGLFGYSVAYKSWNEVYQNINMGTVTVTNPPPSTDTSMTTRCYTAGISGFLLVDNLSRMKHDLMNFGTITCNNCTASGIDNAEYTGKSGDYSCMANVINYGTVIGRNAYGISNRYAEEMGPIVSMGLVNGTESSNSIFSTIASGSSSNKYTSLFLVSDGIGCSDEINYTSVYLGENDTYWFEQNGTAIKLSDVFNENVYAFRGSNKEWPVNMDDVQRLFTVIFYGTYESFHTVEKGTHLSELLDDKYTAFFANETEVPKDLIITQHLKLLVLERTSEVSLTINVDDAESVDKEKIISFIKEAVPNGRIICTVIDENTIVVIITVESGTEEDVKTAIRSRKERCIDIICNTTSIIVPGFFLSAAMKSFVDLTTLFIFGIICSASFF